MRPARQMTNDELNAPGFGGTELCSYADFLIALAYCASCPAAYGREGSTAQEVCDRAGVSRRRWIRVDIALGHLLKAGLVRDGRSKHCGYDEEENPVFRPTYFCEPAYEEAAQKARAFLQARGLAGARA